MSTPMLCTPARQLPSEPPATPLAVAVVVSKAQEPSPAITTGLAQVSPGAPPPFTWEMLSSPAPAGEESVQLPTWIRYESPATRPERTSLDEYWGVAPLSSSDARQVAPQSEPVWIASLVSVLTEEFSVSNWYDPLTGTVQTKNRSRLIAVVALDALAGLKQVPGSPPSKPLVVAPALFQGNVPVPATTWGVAQVSFGTVEVWVMLSRPCPTAAVSFQLPTWIRY